MAEHDMDSRELEQAAWEAECDRNIRELLDPRRPGAEDQQPWDPEL